MGFLSQLVLFVTMLALVEFNSGQTELPSNQTLEIGNDDPCAAELGVASPSDNLSCEFVAAGGTLCYSRSELCNGDRICFTGSDEGDNIPALDCEFIIANKGGALFAI
jgi:hypothetical protein